MRSVKLLLAAGAALFVCSSLLAAALPAPTGLTATHDDTEGIRLTWSKVDGAAYYVVYRYGSKTSQTGLVTEKVTGTTWYDTSCEAGFDIPYRVRAFNKSNAGGEYSFYTKGYRKPLLEPYHGGRCSVNPLADAGVGESFKVKCNVKWTASADDWILLNSASFGPANDPQDLGFSLAENTTGVPRRGTITIHAGSSSAQLTVVQGAVTVSGFDAWNGDTAHTVIEDAAFPDQFLFRRECESGFASAPDVTAVGGSCLKSAPVAVGERAVISWLVPNEWALRFRWRKDTANANDDLALYVGGLTKEGAPDLVSAKRLATCESTEWTQVEVEQDSVFRMLFFVYEKKTGGTADPAAGFGFIDDFLLMTEPQELTFLAPAKVDSVSGNWRLSLPCDASIAVAAEILCGHTVTYGGEEHEVRARVYPSWQNNSSDTAITWCRGTDAKADKTVFSYGGTVTGTDYKYVQMRAGCGFWMKGVSTWLDVFVTSSAASALDCAEISPGDAADWVWAYDVYAKSGESSVSSGVPVKGEPKAFSVRFTGQKVFRFSYRLPNLASDESVVVNVDGASAINLSAPDDDSWHEVSLYIADAGEHEVTWLLDKIGDEPAGSGVSLDAVSLADLPTSLVVNCEEQSKQLVDAVMTKEAFSLTVAEIMGGDWLAVPTPTEPLDMGAYPFAFGIAKNEAMSVRSGRLQLVCGTATNFVRVVQARANTYGTEVTDLAISPDVDHLAAGVPVAFTASFKIGNVQTTGFSALEWSQDLGAAATIDGGVFLASADEVTDVANVWVSVTLGEKTTGQSVCLHPSPSKAVPSGIAATADGWWVEVDSVSGEYYLATDLVGAKDTAKDLTLTVTGPGIFRCEGKGYQMGAGFYLDGNRVGGASGSDWSDATPVEVPEGEHTLVIQYVKQEDAGTYADVAAIRAITWTPLTFAGVELQGPSALTSGSKGSFTLVKQYRNDETGDEMTVPVTVDGSSDIALTSVDPRTADLVKIGYGKDGFTLKIPFAVTWSDTLTVTVTADDAGVARVGSAEIQVTATDVGAVLDYASSDFAVLADGVSTDAAVVTDATATGGTCLRLTSTGTYSPSTVTLKVMDGGIVSFKYLLQDTSGLSSPASLDIYVDGTCRVSYNRSVKDWTSGAFVVGGSGPHLVEWRFTPSAATDLCWCDLDNIQWQARGASSTVTGCTVVGPDDLDGNESPVYEFALTGTFADDAGGTLTQVSVAPDSWELQFVSGDAAALKMMNAERYCSLAVSQSVSAETHYTLVGRYTIGGVTYQGSLDITVPVRVDAFTAIFDSGTYDTCWSGGGNGWNGTFSDHSAGDSCAKCETPSVGDKADLTLVLFGKGTLAFDWKVSCASGDALEFYKVDDGSACTTSITGTGAGWQHVSITYDDEYAKDGSPISRCCRWSFAKNGSGSAGSDCGWIDNVTWSGTTPMQIASGEVKVGSTSLAPGESASVSVDFYRLSQGQSKTPATGSDLPTVDGYTIFCGDPELMKCLSLNKDGAGGLAVSVDAGCTTEGSFQIEAKYFLYGYEEAAYSGFVQVTKGAAPKTMSAAAGPRAMASLTASALSAPAMKAMAANGVNTVGECLVAGLDPEDETAQFTATVTMTNGVPYISWSPNVPDRKYVIKGKASLTDPDWIAPTNSTHRFFKVEIEW